MSKTFLAFCIILLFAIFSKHTLAQNLYFPTNSQWNTTSPEEMDWCTEYIDSLNIFLENKKTKGFIVLKDGKIVIEKYFGTFTSDSNWYWASSGKSLMALLIGIAQEENKLNILDKTSSYLGEGWTSCTPQQEEKITLKHQLSMNTGLDDKILPSTQIPDPLNCMLPECLKYKTDVNTRWAYHNAPYRLLQDVLESATGSTKNLFTYNKLRPLDFRGLWIDYIFYSNPRQMAKFGLLMLAKGKWDNIPILSDSTYFNQMLRSSQQMNPAYGYLWWLNGKESYRLPRVDLDFNGYLVPTAPSDMYMALGKNDQKIYVVPSQNLVVVRVGHSADESMFALSSFDTQLWSYLTKIMCNTMNIEKAEPSLNQMVKSFNCQQIQIESDQFEFLEIYDISGKKLAHFKLMQGLHSYNLNLTKTALYLLKFNSTDGNSIGFKLVTTSE